MEPLYIDPFWVGVVIGAFAMTAFLIVVSVLYGKRRG